jgi:hypothetical protein
MTAEVLQQLQLAEMNVRMRRFTLRNYLTNASMREDWDKRSKERIQDYRDIRRQCSEQNERNEITKGSS